MQKLNFYHTTKWYTNEPKSVLENETHNILLNFEIQTDPQILTRRFDLVLINKKEKKARKKKEKKKRELSLMGFNVPADDREKIKDSEKINEYLDLAWELKYNGTCRWRWYQL